MVVGSSGTATVTSGAGFVCFSTSWKYWHLPPVSCQVKESAPRARGDGPWDRRARVGYDGCSPRTRGWTRQRVVLVGLVILLPAHAGMDPRRSRSPLRRLTAPRASGDGPSGGDRAQVGPPCSPRTRGWTRPWHHQSPATGLLPAHAGMDPVMARRTETPSAAPRAARAGVAGAAEWRLPPLGQRSSSSSKRRMAGGSVSVGGTFMVLRAKDMMSLNTGPAASPP